MLNFLERAKNLKILVVGDVMLDRYSDGISTRLSQEAPVPIFKAKSIRYRPGGAANVAVVARAFGADVHVAGIVGVDKAGWILQNLLSAQGIHTQGLFFVPGRWTTVKTRIMVERGQLLRIDEEQTDWIGADLSSRLVAYVSSMMKMSPDIVIIEDYGKGVVSPDLIKGILSQDKEQDTIVSVDPKHKWYEHYQGVDLLTPNHYEACMGMGIDPIESSDNVLFDHLSQYRKDLGIGTILVTCGKKGIYVIGEGKSYWEPVEARYPVWDVTGAGDAVIVAASITEALGYSDQKMAKIANLAASQVVSKVGACAPDMEMLQREIQEEMFDDVEQDEEHTDTTDEQSEIAIEDKDDGK